ncbi:MAG TPA: ABC transporter permease [Steroidobacteraceae bacterium]|jgi:putative ABC transport system permease protein|nr:ABC transporter permease [Steroidobacteraceae bacterium]
MSLALSTLLYEWRRYLAAVIALAVAGLLVLSMAGMFMGMGKTFTATIDRSPAEVMVLPPQAVTLFANNGGQPRRIIPGLYAHPDVVEVQPLNGNFGFWSNFPKDGQPPQGTGVQVVGIEPVEGSVTLPSDFSPSVVDALKEPFAVVVDRSTLGKLGVQLGDKAKINGRTVRVRATLQGYPSMFNAIVFMSRQTTELLGLSNAGPMVGPLAVKIRDPLRATQVADELNILGKGQYKAWPRAELSRVSRRSMLKEGGISVMIGFAVVIGAFIGVVITWQTLQGAILANLKEFASLRALGVSMGSLRRIVMELSLWVGFAGLVLTSIMTALVWLLADQFGVPLDFPLFIDIPVAIALPLIAVLSGVLSLRILTRTQPVDLLR